MTFSIRARIREFVAPNHSLSISSGLWRKGLAELHRRGEGQRESGAFLLGILAGKHRSITRFIFFDDLDPHCLDSGIVVFDGSGYGPLWEMCRKNNLKVIADVHTHPSKPYQSTADRDHPMIAHPGHVALIVPEFACRTFAANQLGIYVYQGNHQWVNYSGKTGKKYFYIGMWG